MVDIVNVGLKVDSRDVKTGTKELDRFGKQAGKTQTATGKLTSSFKRMLGPLLAMASATAALRKLIDTARQFDVINASLITVTGSTEAASKAFEGLQAFASTTPFALQEVTNAFIKMKALGLDPSSRSLTSFGNTASAMGKSLNQMVEAVADASTFEFERLKEFGIKARQQADSVSFTFRGVTTTVDKSSKEIQDYLLAIGENDFAGAMERRANSLDGALSNLSDTWDALFLTITKYGPGDVIADTVREASEAIEQLDILISSGAFVNGINAIGTQFFETGKDIENALNEITRMINEASDHWGIDGSSSAGFIADAFINLPSNIRAAIQLATIEIAVFVDKVSAYGSAIANAMNPKNWFDEKDIMGGIEEEINSINSVRDSSIEKILKEREAIINRSKTEIEAAKVSFEIERSRREARSATIEATGEAEEAAVAAAMEREQEAWMEQELNRAIHDEEELERIYEQNQRKLEAEKAYHDELYNISSEFEWSIAGLKKAIKDEEYKDAVAHGLNLLMAATKNSKKMHGIYKAAAISKAVIDTYTAANGAYSALANIPIIGPALGIAAAAAAVVSGMARVKAIQSTSIGSSSVSSGGGSASIGSQASGTGSATAPAALPEEREVKHTASIVISGGLHSDEDVRNLVSRINDVQEDMGGQVSFVTS